jgi:DNA mismatch repair protein MutL
MPIDSTSLEESLSAVCIQVLPPYLVNRIAAGEVIERPASVVKELVENALDAGSTRIEILIGNAGRNIRVADNGQGMTAKNATVAFLNHATSKIRTVEDLDQINTLGFRGEALASIASISKFTCLTRTPDTPQGTRITVNETGEPFAEEVGCAVGTIMDVQDLFYNTPARLKFLKRAQTELGHIEEMVQMLALSHPAVQMTLKLNDKEVLKTAGDGTLRHVLNDVYKLAQNPIPLVPVATEDEPYGFRLAGYVSEPGHMKSSRRWMVQFVNGRLVRCPILQKAVENAYESLLPHGRYPFSVLFLTVPADRIDINVHPAKREIRYADSATIFSFVRGGVRNTLIAQGAQPTYTAHPEYASSQPESDRTGSNLTVSAESGGQSSGYASRPSNLSGQGIPDTQKTTQGFFTTTPYAPGRNSVPTQVALDLYRPHHADELPLLEADNPSSCRPDDSGNASTEKKDNAFERFKVLGQLFQTYILLETPQGLIVVDQHIASERTVFERLSRNFTAEKPAMQRLLTHAPIAVSPTQQALLLQEIIRFQQLGFLYTVDEAASVVTLTGYPLVYQNRDKMFANGGLFENLLAQLEETGKMALDVELLIATLACHTAVRAGDSLSTMDMETVVTGWLNCTLPWTCPHGRPIAHTISKEQLNHFFHRTSLPVNA